MSGYRPLFWSWFGGRGGIYLASLVKIRIIGVIGRIDFFFDRPEVPTGCRSFGRIDDSEDSEDEDNETVEFPIDRPRGEIIDRVEIRQGLFLEGATKWLRREGHLTWLKVLFLPTAEDKLVSKCPILNTGTDIYKPRADV